ncbi:hypothetical protein D3C87_1005710 [compost metagenome]
MHTCVEHGVGVRFAQPGIGLVAVGVAGVTHATANAEAVEDAGVPGVIGPQRRLLVRHQLQAIALVDAILHFGFGQGVGSDDFQVVGDVGNRFQLEAFDFHFAGLTGDRDVVDEGVDRDVLLGEVVHGGGQQGFTARWLVLDAQFPLLAFGRFERTRRGSVGTRGRLEGFGVRQVRHETVVEDITERCVAAEGLVTLGVGGIALVDELCAGVHPVFTAAEGQAPLVEGHLVLNVQAGLVGFLVVIVKRRRARWTYDWLAVDRGDHVGGQTVAEDRGVVGVAALMIQAQQ